MKPDKNNEKKNNSGGNQTWFAGKPPIYIYFDDFWRYSQLQTSWQPPPHRHQFT